MDRQQIKLVKASWDRLDDNAPAVIDTFFGNLFTAHPELREKFPEDLTSLRDKLVKGADVVVGGLSFLSLIGPVVKGLGFGADLSHVSKEQIDAVGAALLDTLSTADAAHWSIELDRAWLAAFEAILAVFK